MVERPIIEWIRSYGNLGWLIVCGNLLGFLQCSFKARFSHYQRTILMRVSEFSRIYVRLQDAFETTLKKHCWAKNRKINAKKTLNATIIGDRKAAWYAFTNIHLLLCTRSRSTRGNVVRRRAERNWRAKNLK